MICPSCFINREKRVEMLKYNGIPEYLDIRPYIKSHPLAIVRGFAERTAGEVITRISDKIYYYKCRECGYIEIHER
jgi:rubrerythrin